MSEIDQMMALVKERLNVAVDDIFGIIENVIQVYEEKDSRSKWEIERQNNLLEILLKPKIKFRRADPPQLSVCKDEVPPEQQERSPSLGQEDPEPPQIKEEQEETWTSQEGEQLQWLEEADTKDSVLTITSVKSLHDQHQSQFPHLNQTVENREGEPLPSTSTEQMETEADGEDWGEGERSYNCSVCGKVFSRQDRVQRHMKTHTGEKPYSCSVCGKGFSRQDRVQIHMKTHTGEKPYSCSVCGKGFIQTPHLQKHMKTHTGEKPYSCSVCGKGFSRQDRVQIHMKTHTGERPYSCSFCGKGFITSSDLKRHMKTHTGERPYSCCVCGKGYITSSELKKHMRIHTGERP